MRAAGRDRRIGREHLGSGEAEFVTDVFGVVVVETGKGHGRPTQLMARRLPAGGIESAAAAAPPAAPGAAGSGSGGGGVAASACLRRARTSK